MSKRMTQGGGDRPPSRGLSGGRLLALDCMRTVAVLLVLGHHMPAPTPGTAAVLRLPALFWKRGGWVGVDLFFVLSGFLVSGLLFREYQEHGEIRFGRFFLRRGLKIYPAFYCFIAVTIVVRSLTHKIPRLSQVLCEILFIQNYGQRLWAHTWSLAIEEHFYVLLALLLFWLSRPAGGQRARISSLPWICLTVSIAALGLRMLTARRYEYAHAIHLYPTHLRIDSLLFGALLSYYFHTQRERFVRFCSRHSRLLTIMGLMLLSPPFLFRKDMTPFVYTIGFSFAYLGSGMLIAAAVSREFREGPMMRFMGYLGAHSYSVYLWHLAVLDWVMVLIGRVIHPLPLPFVAAAPLFVGLSFAIGVILANLIELPVMRLRDHYFPSRSLPLPTPAGMSGAAGSGGSSSVAGEEGRVVASAGS